MGDDRYQRTGSGMPSAWTIAGHCSRLQDVLDTHPTRNENRFLDLIKIDIWRRPDKASSYSDTQGFPNYLPLLLPEPLSRWIVW